MYANGSHEINYFVEVLFNNSKVEGQHMNECRQYFDYSLSGSSVGASMGIVQKMKLKVCSSAKQFESPPRTPAFSVSEESRLAHEK